MGANGPQVLHIPEEDEERGKNQTKPDVEEHQATNRKEKKKEMPAECNSVDETEQEEHAESQAKVNQGLNVFREQEQILRYIDLCKNPRVSNQ